jgi:hypothetical protein
VKTCNRCNGGHLSRISRVSIAEFALSTVGYYPYLCRNCKYKTFALRPKQAVLAITFALGVIGVTNLGLFYLNSRYQMRERVAPEAPASGSGDLHPEPVPQGAAAEPVATANPAGPLTNEDIIRLCKSGVGTTSLSSLIRRSEHRFTVDAGSISKLRQSGVPEAVILTMMELSAPVAN